MITTIVPIQTVAAVACGEARGVSSLHMDNQPPFGRHSSIGDLCSAKASVCQLWANDALYRTSASHLLQLLQ